ncbi:Cerato-platanin, partial [Lasiosphaeria miniovina]
VTYDAGYDEANRTLEELMCSDGENGVMWKYGWETQADVPSFPYIGGVQTISEWNSTNCGTCWQATYRGKTIYILAIDFTTQGLNIGFDAMNDLTSGRAWALGRVDAIVTEVPLSSCGL